MTPRPGSSKIPILNPAPCVPVPKGDNGGATSPGVTATTIKIGYYSAKPDPLYDPILKAAGAYDSPEDSAKAVQDYVDIYAHQYEMSGRTVELVKIQGTGASTDEVAAKADADKAAAAGVFAVIGGPAQAQSFQSELARKKILCIGTCVIAAPQSHARAVLAVRLAGRPDARTDLPAHDGVHREAAQGQERRSTPATPRCAVSLGASRSSATTRPTASTRTRGRPSTTT